jgi:2-alkenal reductase
VRLLQPVTFADSEGVFVGQSVMAIGSPFGQDFTLTTGIVSALDRSLNAENNFSIPEVIQTDAAINPGNSGGPLLNMNGEVIGVNTAILSRNNTNSGVGFSVPSNQVRRVVPYLIQFGGYEHSWLGISGTDLQPSQLNAMKLQSDLRGVMIAGLTPNGPAANAGLQGANQSIDAAFGSLPLNGDIITAINGVPLGQMSDLISYLTSTTLPGDTVSVTVVRDGQSLDVPVTLQPRP